MTLNVVAACPHAVFLSGDFRLSTPLPGSPGTYRPLPDNFDIQKLVPIVRGRWAGLIAYTGDWILPQIPDVGAWIGKHVDDAPPDETPHHLVKQFSSAADAALAKSRGRLPELALSFVGFEERHCFTRLVSNFLDKSYRRTTTDTVVRASCVRPRSAAVHSSPRIEEQECNSLLEALSDRPIDVDKVHNLLAKINAAAALRSNGTISPACVTGSVDVVGNVLIRPYDIPPGRYLPSFILRELEAVGIRGLEGKLDENGMPLPPRWVGTSARYDDREGNMVAVAVIRNVASPIGGGATRPRRSAAWKVAGPDEPKTYTVTFPKRSKKK